MLTYGFMQKALLVGMIIGVVGPLIGNFVVLRKMSVIGDGLSHVALSGVALSFVLGISPAIGAIVMALIAAWFLQKMRDKYEKQEEIAMAILMSGGIALALVLLGFSKGNSSSLTSYLFGSINSIDIKDVYMVILLAICIIIFVKRYFYQLFHISFDEESAKVAGIEVDYLNKLFVFMIAFCVVTAMRITGVLLISALMVIPVAAAFNIAKNFKEALITSIIFGEISVVLGITTSYYFDLPPGGSIVLIGIGIMGITFLKKGSR